MGRCTRPRRTPTGPRRRSTIPEARTSPTPRLLIAIGLCGYGLYRALYVPAMLVGPSIPLLLVGFLLQAVFGILAGIGVWRGALSAPLLVVLLGASIAATALIEGFVFGIVAYLRALLEAVAAIVLALLIAVYVKHRLGASDDSDLNPHAPLR